MVACQRRSDIVVVQPRHKAAAVVAVVAHASTMAYAAQAPKTAEWIAARAERTNRTRFRKDVPDHTTCSHVLSRDMYMVVLAEGGIVFP